MSNSQRKTGYSALIPFYVLYDLDLNANHLRIYGQVAQMELMPNDNVRPTFSNKWMSDQLNINERNIQKHVKLLCEKGHLRRIKVKQNFWQWEIVRSTVISDESFGGVSERRGVESLSDSTVESLSDSTVESLSDTQKNRSINNKSISTGASSYEVAVSAEETLFPETQTPKPTVNQEGEYPGVSDKELTKFKRPNQMQLDMIAIYREVFPDNPQPHKSIVSIELGAAMNGLIRNWRKITDGKESFNLESFRRYLEYLRYDCSQFSTKEYSINGGKQRVNDMITFCRTNNAIKTFEGKYND